jgi:hypothetical protein
MDAHLNTALALLQNLTVIVGAASMIVQGIAMITGITASTADDEVVSKVQKGLVKAQKILNGVALNEVKAKRAP